MVSISDLWGSLLSFHKWNSEETEHRSVSILGIQDEMYIYRNEEQRKISTGMDPLPKVATYSLCESMPHCQMNSICGLDLKVGVNQNGTTRFSHDKLYH